MTAQIVLPLVAAWIALGVVAGFVMARRGHNARAWIVLGGAFGPFVVPYALGVIHTEMVDRFTAGDREALEQLVASEPVGRLSTPDEVADAVVSLVSDRSGFVTGQALAVDGGMVAR